MLLRMDSKTTQAQWDVFICHAGEDKGELVGPLAEELRSRGLSVWYDEFELKVGDSLRGRVDHGLANSQHGIVVLSPSFFGKSWTEAELDGLVALEESGRRRILPIWHKVGKREVTEKSPMLAGRWAAKANQPIPALVDELLESIGTGFASPPSKAPRRALAVSPPPIEVELRMLPSGAGLIEALVGQHEGRFDFDSIPDIGLRSEIAADVQEIRDLAEIWDDLSLPDREDAKSRATELVLGMLDKQLIPQVGHYERRLTGPDEEPSLWRGVVMRVAPAEVIREAQLRQASEPSPSDLALGSEDWRGCAPRV
jgi:TIR domain